MPRIFDNIDQKILDSLKVSLKDATRADFCVGYFNLRGWKLIHDEIEQFSGNKESYCRLLVGMHRLPKDELYQSLAIGSKSKRISSSEVIRLRKQVAEEFRQQLITGTPTNEDERGLQKLKKQLESKKLRVKLYLRHPLHAKLYIIPQNNPNLPAIAFLGSSNLTFSGLSGQGELNIDVVDHDATQKLQTWFNERWDDNFCVDISEELAEILDQSWATDKLIPPYYIYLKMAYHLSQEARDGLNQYQIPSGFKLFDFQEAAVKIAANHVNRRGGVIIADVVGLGKTVVGTAIAKMLEEDFGWSTLIICPKNLVSMWESYKDEYGLSAKIMSMSRVIKDLSYVPARFRIVLIDESHNLRNREGQRYGAIKEYIELSGSKCILLTATPYNKAYLDLSAQLRLFISEDKDIGLKPEALIRELGGENQFSRNYPQTPIRTLLGFEKSQYSEDWQQLMNRYMIRRTRSFITKHYAQTDQGRKYLEFSDGSKSYFPTRIAKTARFRIGDTENDPYARLYSARVVDVINNLSLPRYGLGNYEKEQHLTALTSEEKRILEGLSRAGERLLGFCRTNLFKRLESSGEAFIRSLERHIIRNYVYLYAIDQDQAIPIGTQDAEFLDTRNNDEDTDSVSSLEADLESQGEEETEEDEFGLINALAQQEDQYKQKAAEIYQLYRTKYGKRFKWLRPSLFDDQLRANLLSDALSLIAILNQIGEWKGEKDEKLTRLITLLTEDHPHEKILVFTQFADTAYYLGNELKKAGINQLEVVTGSSNDPTVLAHRFSPKSNGKQVNQELRILIATDVLSEGQNLQDCAIIVNYDLPWAIIRLIQRAGRVDRIGQSAETILCYSFFPADGVERLINLRGRLMNRLQENAEVVGTDERFFEGSAENQVIIDLYTEKSVVIEEEEEEGEIDLTSQALQIWKDATDANPNLAKIIENLQNVVYSTRHHLPTPHDPEGVIVYLRTAEGIDALGWVDKNGNAVTQSQMRILRMARCSIETAAKERQPLHHDLVAKGTKLLIEQSKSSSGKLGHPRGAKARTYERLNYYIAEIKQKTPILAQGEDWELLTKAVEDIYNYPLKQTAIIKLNRQLRSGITDEQLASMVTALKNNDALCVIHSNNEDQEAQIICSLGLFGN